MDHQRPAAPLPPPGLPSPAGLWALAVAALAVLLSLAPVAAQESDPANPFDPFAPIPQLYVTPPVVDPPMLLPDELADGYALGNPDAPVTVEVWEDFQCPYCRFFTAQVEPLIVGTYVADGRVRYVFHQLPFLGEESRWAAVAADLAAEQDRFWPMHAYIFANWMGENRRAFTPARLWDMAQAAGLDMEAFTAGMELGAARARWEKVIARAESEAGPYGVNSTPTVVVQGSVVEEPGWESVQPAIEAALAAAAGSPRPEPVPSPS